MKIKQIDKVKVTFSLEVDFTESVISLIENDKDITIKQIREFLKDWMLDDIIDTVRQDDFDDDNIKIDIKYKR